MVVLAWLRILKIYGSTVYDNVENREQYFNTKYDSKHVHIVNMLKLELLLDMQFWHNKKTREGNKFAEPI